MAVVVKFHTNVTQILTEFTENGEKKIKAYCYSNIRCLAHWDKHLMVLILQSGDIKPLQKKRTSQISYQQKQCGNVIEICVCLFHVLICGTLHSSYRSTPLQFRFKSRASDTSTFPPPLSVKTFLDYFEIFPLHFFMSQLEMHIKTGGWKRT